MKILVTCPPMIGMKDTFESLTGELGWETHYAATRQVLSEDELIDLLPEFDGWIIGDDPATRRVLQAGKDGRLRAAVKWGVGTDNVDFTACKDLGLSIANTPGMFGREVADIALGYLISLFRHTYRIDREIRQGGWPKYAGRSLSELTVGVVGLGDIGQQIVKRLKVLECEIVGYDPVTELQDIQQLQWPRGIESCDAIIFCCALTPDNTHMFNQETLAQVKTGVRIINVARGPLLQESAILAGLNSRAIHSVALDVFEEEPLSAGSPFLQFDDCIVGSHNASNTQDAVIRTSKLAIDLLHGFLQ